MILVSGWPMLLWDAAARRLTFDEEQVLSNVNLMAPWFPA
jgi:hypothetical protein